MILLGFASGLGFTVARAFMLETWWVVGFTQSFKKGEHENDHSREWSLWEIS